MLASLKKDGGVPAADNLVFETVLGCHEFLATPLAGFVSQIQASDLVLGMLVAFLSDADPRQAMILALYQVRAVGPVIMLSRVEVNTTLPHDNLVEALYLSKSMGNLPFILTSMGYESWVASHTAARATDGTLPEIVLSVTAAFPSTPLEVVRGVGSMLGSQSSASTAALVSGPQKLEDHIGLTRSCHNVRSKVMAIMANGKQAAIKRALNRIMNHCVDLMSLPICRPEQIALLLVWDIGALYPIDEKDLKRSLHLCSFLKVEAVDADRKFSTFRYASQLRDAIENVILVLEAVFDDYSTSTEVSFWRTIFFPLVYALNQRGTRALLTIPSTNYVVWRVSMLMAQLGESFNSVEVLNLTREEFRDQCVSLLSIDADAWFRDHNLMRLTQVPTSGMPPVVVSKVKAANKLGEKRRAFPPAGDSKNEPAWKKSSNEKSEQGSQRVCFTHLAKVLMPSAKACTFGPNCDFKHVPAATQWKGKDKEEITRSVELFLKSGTFKETLMESLKKA